MEVFAQETEFRQTLIAMSLLDALLLDPHPFAVWIACRTDGVKGSGTASDPYDGSSATKFDALMNILSANTHVRIGPGTFQTSGYAAGVSGGWQPKAGMKISGAGLGVTTLQLVNATTTNAHYFAVGAPTTTPLDYFELSELTIDCALPSNQSVACGAVRVMGNHVRIRDVKCVNWGSRITTQPGFVIALVIADPDTGAPVLTVDDAGIEDCVAVNPSANNTVSGGLVNVFHVGGQEVTGAALTQFGRGPFIRNCFVDCGSPTSPVAEYRGLSMGACTGGVVEGNQIHNTRIGGPYQEKLNTREIIVRHNIYRNVIKGPFWNLGSSSSIGVEKLVVEGNQIQLIADTVTPTPVGIQLSDPNTVVTPPPYPHGQVVIRRNVIRYVDSTPGSFNGYGTDISGASAAIVSDNVVEVTPANPIRNKKCGAVAYLNNRTPAGVLVQGWNQDTARKYDELETEAEDALVLAMFNER